MPLEPLICRSRYGKVKESDKNKRKFGDSEKTRIFVVLKETKKYQPFHMEHKKQKNHGLH